MRVYLTGGSGLVGSHVAARLRARRDDVVCLQRKNSDTTFLRSIGCRIVAGDVKDGATTLGEGMAGCDALVHAAALVYVGGPWPRLRAVNVDGTDHVIRAAGAAKVRRVVHVSSVAVYGWREGPVDERAPLDGALQPNELYARSKREAEAAAQEAAASARLELVRVRPAALFGERDRLLAPRLEKVLRLPVVPLLGTGENALPVLYAGNAADAVVRVLDAGRDGEAYNVGSDGRLTQHDLLGGLAGALGRTPRFVHFPASLVREGARLAELIGVNLPGGGDLTFERLARVSLGENPYCSERLRSELGWNPPYTQEEGLRRTAGWLQEATS